MAIDKSLYQQPTGLPGGNDTDFLMNLPENSVMQENEDGTVDVVFGDEPAQSGQIPFAANLAEYMEESDLMEVANQLLGDIDSDISSRKEWAETYIDGLEVLGLEYEERSDPWEGACGAYSTVLAEAAIRFQAETMSETFPSMGPVKVKILGELTPEKQQAGERVKVDMNYELTEVMSEYRPEHERMLYALGLAGSAFKKVYYDPNLGRQVALYIPAEDVLVPYGASNLEDAERVTHVMRKTKNEVYKLQLSGFYRDIDIGSPSAYHSDIEQMKAKRAGYELSDDPRHTIYEVHAELVIPGINEGSKIDDDREVALPYVVAIDRSSSEILSIRRNWDPNDSLKRKRQHFVHYVYVPGFGFYGLGLLHIIGGYARAGTSLIRQLVDAGTLANLQGGFKTRGLRIEGDNTPIGAGEWKDVDIPSGTLRDNIFPLPYKEPSATLLALLDRLTEEGRRLGAVSDVNISDMSANAPVGTTLAMLERTLKPMTAVQARVHYSMKQEFKLLHKIIAKYAPKEYGYVPDRAEARAKRDDYAIVEVIPVSDPSSSTMAQRVVQMQAVHQLSQSAPQLYDLPQLHRQMIETMGVKNADKLIPTDEDAKPLDPVSENMDALIGKPMKAFIYQDHDAHLAAHQAFMQDPMIMSSIGQNPMAQQIQASLMAHIAEHLAFSYRKQIEEKLGAPLPTPKESLPPEVEVQLSRLVADAGRQLTQTHQQQAAQQAAEQQAKDPVFQQKEKELQIKAMAEHTKAAEVERKRAKDAMDKDTDEKEIAVDVMKVQAEQRQKDRDRQTKQADTNRKLQADVARDLLTAARSTGKDSGDGGKSGG